MVRWILLPVPQLLSDDARGPTRSSPSRSARSPGSRRMTRPPEQRPSDLAPAMSFAQCQKVSY